MVKMIFRISCSLIALLALVSPTHADETCMSPYMAKMNKTN